MRRLEMKKALIRELAECLVGDQAAQSIKLQMGKPSAQKWARMRSVSGVSGYPTVDEAEASLTELLG